MRKPRATESKLSNRELAKHDEEMIRDATAEHPTVALPPAHFLAPESEAGGRRADDRESIVVVLEREIKSKLFWIFGILLETRPPHKPSMARLLLAAWTYVGWLMIHHELILVTGRPALQNAVWTAWWAAEGFFALWVAGSKFAPYFAPGAAGAAAATAIGSAARDPVVAARREQARSLGSDGTEYTP